MYLDSAYIAKFYVNESDSQAVRELIRGADSLVSSAWAIGEVRCVLHRHMREDRLTQRQFRELLDAFLRHTAGNVWTLLPVTARTLQEGGIAGTVGAWECLSPRERRCSPGGCDGS